MRVECKSAQADLPKGEIRQKETDLEDILQKIDLSRIADLDPTVQQEVHSLICEYACIFLQNDLDLGRTLIIKHSIKLKDPTPFKECHKIPPGMCYVRQCLLVLKIVLYFFKCLGFHMHFISLYGTLSLHKFSSSGSLVFTHLGGINLDHALNNNPTDSFISYRGFYSC